MASDLANNGDRLDSKDLGVELEAGLSIMSDKQAALTVERFIDPTASNKQLCDRAGYSPNTQNHKDIVKRAEGAASKKIASALARHGLDGDKLAVVIKDALTANTKRPFCTKGGDIIYAEEQPDHKTRLMAAKFLSVLNEMMPAQKHKLELGGTITAEPSVYKVSLPERKARVLRAREVRVRYPEHDPTGQPSEGDRDIRERTERLFAEKLVKKFYEHKVPIE